MYRCRLSGGKMNRKAYEKEMRRLHGELVALQEWVIAGTMLVAFTGYCQDEDRRRLAEVGFEHHVVKPAGIGELAKILDALPGSE